MKTFGALIYLFKNLVLFFSQENILHSHTALASIQVDTSTIALFLCCADKDAALLHAYDYYFILSATFYLMLYTQACCNGTGEHKVSLNSVTYLYTVSCLKLNYVYFTHQAIQAPFVHFENLNYSSREQYYSNKFSHNAIGSDCH